MEVVISYQKLRLYADLPFDALCFYVYNQIDFLRNLINTCIAFLSVYIHDLFFVMLAFFEQVFFFELATSSCFEAICTNFFNRYIANLLHSSYFEIYCEWIVFDEVNHGLRLFFPLFLQFNFLLVLLELRVADKSCDIIT